MFRPALIDDCAGRPYAPAPSGLEPPMRRIAALLLASLAFAAPARADDDVRPFAQVPLVPLPESIPADVDALLKAHWTAYWNGSGENAFSRDNVRIGRIDLNGDNRAELVVMIDAPGWEAEPGNPYVVAQWTKGRWNPIGWGWGDEDTVFATTEAPGGWRTLDGGKQLLRWNGSEYRPEDKPAPVYR